MYSGLNAKKKFVGYVWLCWFIRVGRVIDLLVFKSLSNVGFVACVVVGDHRLCSGLVGVCQGI